MMDVDVDSAYILYGLGAVLGIISVLYFGQEVLLSLSPTVKSIILFLSFAFFFVSGHYTRTALLDTVLYILSAGAYIIFLGYTIFRFTFSTNQVFVALALSSVLFIGLGYVVREQRFTLPTRAVRFTLAGIAVIVLALVLFDAVSPQATTELELEDMVNAEDAADNDAVIGTFTLRNPFVFSRMVDVPRFSGCLHAPNLEGPMPTFIETRDPGPGLLHGGEVRTVDLTVRFRVIPPDVERDGLTQDDYRELGEIPIQQMSECPETIDTAMLVVTDETGPMDRVAFSRH